MSSKAEREFLARYQPADYPRPAVTVDLVVLTLLDTDLKVLLVQRREHPFKDHWALPGGFLRVGDARKDQGEDLDDAARRELQEETRLDPRQIYLEQLYTFGRAGRDPRMRRGDGRLLRAGAARPGAVRRGGRRRGPRRLALAGQVAGGGVRSRRDHRTRGDR